MIRRGDIDPTRLEPDGDPRAPRRELARPGEHLGKVRAGQGSHVQDDEEGSGEILRQTTNDLPERRHSSRGGSDDDDIPPSQEPSPHPGKSPSRTPLL